MKYKGIFWGLLLVTIGILFLLKNLGLICFSWCGLWMIWPVLLIFWGITILPVNDLTKTILSVIAIILGVVLLLTAPRCHKGFYKGFIEEHAKGTVIFKEMEDGSKKIEWQVPGEADSNDTVIVKSDTIVIDARGVKSRSQSSPEKKPQSELPQKQ